MSRCRRWTPSAAARSWKGSAASATICACRFFMSPMTNAKSTSSPRPGSRSRNPAESDRASAPLVRLDDLFHHVRNPLAPAPTVELAVMAQAALHQLFLLALRQVDCVL